MSVTGFNRRRREEAAKQSAQAKQVKQEPVAEPQEPKPAPVKKKKSPAGKKAPQ